MDIGSGRAGRETVMVVVVAVVVVKVVVRVVVNWRYA